MKNLCLAIVLFIGGGLCAQLDSSQIAKINSMMQGFAGQNPGVSLSIVHKNGWQHVSNYGLKSYGRMPVCDPKTQFNVASLAKHITAKWMFEFIRTNSCNPNDPITKYLNWLPEFYAQIKIKHLIEHTSGLREFHTLQQLRGINPNKPVREKAIREDLIQFQELSFKPGSRHVYSNTGYYLLYKIGEELAKKHPDLSWERFAEKSGFTNSFWQDGRKCTDCAHGHVYVKSFVPVKSKEEVYGYSNFWTSGTDITQWMHSLLKDDDFLKAAQTMSEIDNNVRLKYNYGLIKTNFMSWDILEHGGIIRGFRSQIRYIPSTGYGICLILNSDVVNPVDYVDRITEIILKQDQAYEGVELSGQVVDSKLNPIPHAYIHINRHTGGALANDSAYFHYRTRDFVDSVTFFASGYETKTLSTEDWEKPKLVKLKKSEAKAMLRSFDQQFNSEFDLPESYGSIAPWVSVPGAEIIKRYPIHGLSSVDTLSAFITKQNKWDTPFRFVVYDVNGETGLPSNFPVFTSEPVVANEPNSWVHHFVGDKISILKGDFFVGIQWLTAAGRRGENAQYLGFYMNKNSNQSYYRVPFDKWRRLGEITFRGNKDVLIQCSFSAEDASMRQVSYKEGFLFDEDYQKIMPLHSEHKHLFIEPYPHSRELRFESDGPNQWVHERADWKFEAAFDNYGKYMVHESSPDRIHKTYEFVEYTYDTENLFSKKQTLFAVNKDVKWKIKPTDKGLKVRIKPFKYMYFDSYKNNYYTLDGDMSFGRLLKIEWNEAKDGIKKLNYSDSRNFGIEFMPKQ